LMQEVSAEKSFQVALMYDEDDSDPASATEKVIADLQYAHDHYISAHAVVARQAYMHYQGRPMVFIFPKNGHTDWNRVRQAVNTWEDPPLLIFKDIPAEYPNAFDGFYAWVNPGKQGWQADGSNWGQQYLDNFYKTMESDYPTKIAVGAAWAAFDDSKASWSQNRKMDSRCGRTFEDTLRLFRHYNQQHPMPFLMVETWNDYEEGTAIEKGLNPCKWSNADASLKLSHYLSDPANSEIVIASAAGHYSVAGAPALWPSVAAGCRVGASTGRRSD